MARRARPYSLQAQVKGGSDLESGAKDTTMKSFLTALLLLSACASTGTPELTFSIERHDGSSSFNSSASQFEEEDYGESEGFSHDVSFSQDAYTVYGVALMIPLGAPVAPSAGRSGSLPPPWTPPPPGGSDEAPETPWYKDVMQWTLDVPPLILAMVLVAMVVLGWMYRDKIRKLPWPGKGKEE